MCFLEQLVYTLFQNILTKQPDSIKLVTTICYGDNFRYIDYEDLFSTILLIFR